MKPLSFDRPAQAEITGPHGIGPFRWYAAYSLGPAKYEFGSFAWTRKGIERKARRRVRRIDRNHYRQTHPVSTVTAR